MNNIDILNIKNKYNLSEMEAVMLSFDVARTIKDNCHYVFEQMLKLLDINCYTYHLYGNRTIHSRSVIHIKDSKYDVDGIYFFDLLWSLKKDDQDDYYKYIYNYFAKTKSYFESLDKEFGLDDYFIGNFGELVDNFYDVALFDSYNEVGDLVIEQINNMSQIADGKSLNLPEKDYDGDVYQIYEKINNYDLLLEKPISGEIFLEVFLNVLKVKYLEGISDDLNLEYLKYVFYNSDWKFSYNSDYDLFRNQNYENDKDKFLANIFNIENIDTIFKTIDYYSNKTGLENRIEKIKTKKINL